MPEVSRMRQFIGVPPYLHRVWQRRYFWLTMVQLDLQLRYRRSVLGIGWSLLHPIAMASVICVAFHSIFQIPLAEYGPFVLAGLAGWNYLTGVVLEGCHCFARGEQYIRTHPNPLAIYPLRTTLGVGVHFLITLGVALLVNWCFNGVGALWPLLSLVPAAVILLVLGWALAILAGIATVHFSDVQYMIQIATQICFYVTPVLYHPDMVQLRRFGTVLHYNPLTHLIALIRDPLIYSRPASAEAYLLSIATTLLAVGLAVFVLRRCEKTMIFHL
jgi:lipopolysaccharide transport system permease protein